MTLWSASGAEKRGKKKRMLATHETLRQPRLPVLMVHMSDQVKVVLAADNMVVVWAKERAVAATVEAVVVMAAAAKAVVVGEVEEHLAQHACHGCSQCLSRIQSAASPFGYRPVIASPH